MTIYRLNLAASEVEQYAMIASAIATNNDNPMVFESPSGELCSPRVGLPELIDLTPEAAGTLMRAWCEPGTWVRSGTEGELEWVPKPSLPIRVVKSYLAKKDWPGVPKIKRIVKAPLVRPDFSVRWEPGWDAATQVWVVPGATRDESLSVEDLLTVFAPFAFAHSVYMADCLALALTPYLTTALTAAYPGGLITAHQPGAGKTQLAQVIGVLANNGLTEVQAWRGSSEMRKAITTALRAGDRVALFDNVKSSIDSPEFEAVITSRGWTDRAMRTHTKMTLTNDTLWLITRNNPDLSSDMARRMIVVLLDKHANPVSWDPGLLPRSLASSDALVTVMVRMIEVWAAAGCPSGSGVLSGFEQWSQAVSGILEANGVTGFMSARTGTLDVAVSTDDDDNAELVTRIAALMGVGAPWTAGDLWDKVHDWRGLTDAAGDSTLLRSWLTSSSRFKEPAKSLGRRVSSLAGQRLPGCEYEITKVARGQYVCTKFEPSSPAPGAAEPVLPFEKDS